MLLNHSFYKLVLVFCSLLLLLFGASCRKETKTTMPTNDKDYFDCSSYNYYPQNTPYPTYTPQDSIAARNYMLRQGAGTAFVNSPLFNVKLFFFRIWGECDTVLHDKIYLNDNRKAYRSLSKEEQLQIVCSDAIITGTVVGVKELVDADRCFAYKTLIAVKIEEVVHVFGKLILHKNDVVLISSFDGLSGGCSPNYDPEKETRQITMPYRHFKKGDYDLFLLSRHAYRDMFLMKNDEYNDIYCPNMFRITDYTESTLNENINESVDDIKRFFKEN